MASNRHPSAVRGAARRGVGVVALLVLTTVIVVGTPSMAAPASPGEPGPVTSAEVRPDPVPSAGCGSSTVAPATETRIDLTVDGLDRWYLRTVPTAHDGSTPLPLVFDFHGLAEGAQVHTLMSGFSAVAEREGFVVVFPQGRFSPVRWDADPSSDPNLDLDYVNAMLDQLGSDLCIDRSRVYADGLSYGAFFTSLVACSLSDRFAAVAPVAGVLADTPCERQRALPMMAIHGTADPILPFNLGPSDPPDLNGPGFPANVATWAGRNGCDPTPTDTPVSDEVLHRVYDCPAGADVEFFIVIGGGHAWPGSTFSQSIEAIVGHTTMDISASDEAWAFFTRFQLPCDLTGTCEEPTPDPSTTTTTSSTTTTTMATTTVASTAAPTAMAVTATPAFTG